jgi:putative aldouronate transport system substrate-binding protein
MTVPMWGTAPSNDDPYFAAVAEAWGGTRVNLRQADGNTYAETAVQWLAANEFGGAITMFAWMANSHTDFRGTVVNTFYDLTDIVKGDISDRSCIRARRTRPGNRRPPPAPRVHKCESRSMTR